MLRRALTQSDELMTSCCFKNEKNDVDGILMDWENLKLRWSI